MRKCEEVKPKLIWSGPDYFLTTIGLNDSKVNRTLKFNFRGTRFDLEIHRIGKNKNWVGVHLKFKQPER